MNTVRSVVRGTGEVLITLGVVILLFCVYQLWWTTVQANAAAEQTTDELLELWESTPPVVAPPSASATEPTVVVQPEDAFAMMRIPRFGEDWYKPVFEGTSWGVLGKGVGHYPDSALPGQVGNFSIAGHRTTYGQPFHNLDSLQQGDVVVVETDDRYFVYRITFTEPQIVEADAGRRDRTGAGPAGCGTDPEAADHDDLPPEVQRQAALDPAGRTGQ